MAKKKTFCRGQLCRSDKKFETSDNYKYARKFWESRYYVVLSADVHLTGGDRVIVAGASCTPNTADYAVRLSPPFDRVSEICFVSLTNLYTVLRDYLNPIPDGQLSDVKMAKIERALHCATGMSCTSIEIPADSPPVVSLNPD